MKKEDVIILIKIAGYHNDVKKMTRLYVENAISRKVADKAWNAGAIAKEKGMACTCYDCSKKKKKIIPFISKPDRYDGHYTRGEPVQCQQVGYEHRLICQGCIDEGHVQMPTSEYLDCKMVFVFDGKTAGQCCCYSKEHGKRGLSPEEWAAGLQKD